MPLRQAFPTYKPGSRAMAAQTQTHKYAIYPAPIKGLDAARPLVAQDPLTAGFLENWWCRKWGPELRGGFKRWTTNLGGGSRRLMAYNAPPGSTGVVEPRLFAACTDGNIYNVTNQTAEAFVPAAVQNIPGQINPGRFSYINVTIAGVTYLAMVSAGAGYWTYDHAGGWVNRTGAIVGAGAAAALKFDYITVWKNRIWFIRADTTEAYYLPADSIQGNANLFDFGTLLLHGGSLAVLASMTIDAGNGIDDRFVVISTEGDVLIYQGTDPTAAATFAIIGRWYVGKVPAGRRFVSDTGGDLAVITERGIEYISRLQSGRGLLDPESVRDTADYRFNQVIGELVKETRGQEFWELRYIPGEGSLIILTPLAGLANGFQFVFSILATAWSTFAKMPMRCCELYQGEFYFANDEGKVYQAFKSNTDDELSGGTVGATIYGAIQTAYVTDPNDPMRLKRPLLVMPMFQAPSPPSISAQINTEWSTLGTPGSPSFSPGGGAIWDSSLWNNAVWSTTDQAYLAWIGANGLGCYSSLRMTVAGMPGTIFTSWKLIYEPGGVM